MNFEDLDDWYYYILASEYNQEFAAEQARDIVMLHAVAERNYPNRPCIIVVEPSLADNKLILAWEFGVIGEILVYPPLDS